MTDRPTTDEIAASIRALARDGRAHAETTRPIVHGLVTELQLRLPHLEAADIAAVLLHTSSCIGGLIARLREEGVDDHVTATIAVNTMAFVGERMHRKAQHATSPDTTSGA